MPFFRPPVPGASSGSAHRGDPLEELRKALLPQGTKMEVFNQGLMEDVPPAPEPSPQPITTPAPRGRKAREEEQISNLEKTLGAPHGSLPRKTGTSPWLSLTNSGQFHAQNLQHNFQSTVDSILRAKGQKMQGEQFDLATRKADEAGARAEKADKNRTLTTLLGYSENPEEAIAASPELSGMLPPGTKLRSRPEQADQFEQLKRDTMDATERRFNESEEGRNTRAEEARQGRIDAILKGKETPQVTEGGPKAKFYVTGDADIDRMVENEAESHKVETGKYPTFSETKEMAEFLRTNPKSVLRPKKRRPGGL